MHKGELQIVLPLLVAAVATETSLPSPPAPTTAEPCALWSFAAVESVSTPTWSIFTPFGPMPQDSGPNQAAVQVYCQGKSAALVLEQLAAIHLALTDADLDHDARRSWQVGSGADVFLLDIFELEEGRLIGNVDQARIDGSLNFVLAYRRLPAA